MISVDLWMGMRLQNKTSLSQIEPKQERENRQAAKCKSYFHILIKFNCPVRHEIKYVSPGNCKIAWMDGCYEHSIDAILHFAIGGRVCELKRQGSVSKAFPDKSLNTRFVMNSLKSESFVMQCVRYYLTMFTRIFNRIIKMNNSNNILNSEGWGLQSIHIYHHHFKLHLMKRNTQT